MREQRGSQPGFLRTETVAFSGLPCERYARETLFSDQKTSLCLFGLFSLSLDYSAKFDSTNNFVEALPEGKNRSVRRLGERERTLGSCIEGESRRIRKESGCRPTRWYTFVPRTVYCDFVPTVGDVDSARDSPCWFREKDSHEEVEWIKGANPDEDSREG